MGGTQYHEQSFNAGFNKVSYEQYGVHMLRCKLPLKMQSVCE